MADLAGRVTAFDFDRGLGEVTADDGCVYPFHCVSIADGSRTIDAGTRVTFDIQLKLGRREAAAITPR